MFLKIKTYRDEETYRILDEIRKLFNSAKKEFNSKKIGEQNGIVNTVCALEMLSFRLSRLCESILSEKDFYTAAIIYRALIEYSVKHKHIFMSCIKKGDDIAKEYVSPDHLSSEMLKKICKALWPPPIKLPPKLKELKRRVDIAAEKFKFSKVSEDMLVMLPKDQMQQVLRHTMVQYSMLSSYVHAGPMAVLDLEEKPKKNIDMSSVLLTIIAYNDTIKLLSLYPSEHQNKLKALDKNMNKKVDEALTIYEEICPAKS